MDKDIEQLRLITAPFAYTSEHVQGPGGNTSYKRDGKMLIKASGFTFKDVDDGMGVVWLNNKQVIDNLMAMATCNDETYANEPPEILDSVPEGLRPSMEFEFHALLRRYVLHTHSIYANVVTCSAQCADVLARLFNKIDYVLVPYVTPGFPIAAWLANNVDTNEIPAIIFLKNHGIIVHGDDYGKVLATYNHVENAIKAHFNLETIAQLPVTFNPDQSATISRESILQTDINLADLATDLSTDILIPDQSIFFRDKILSSAGGSQGIFADIENGQLIISGTQKFIAACKGMIEAVYFIKRNITRSGLLADYIPQDKANIMHSLATEKYRTSLLKNNL